MPLLFFPHPSSLVLRESAMDLKQIAKDTTKTLISYMTYQAMRVVLAQIDETEPKRAYWLHQFTARQSIQDGEAYLQALFKEEQRLAFRILTVREDIAEQIADYLPEMLRAGIQEANIKQRTQQLERMTQIDPTASGTHPEQGSESP
jgi:RbcX protein